MRLDELAVVIRSKNAGPCMLTLDLIFPDFASYGRVAAQRAHLHREISQRYGQSEDVIRLYPYPLSRAIKITLPRAVLAGSIGDTDVYGAQQHRPLLDIEV